MSYHLQEINRRIQADPKEFVDASDAAYAAKIEHAARAIAENAHTCPIVLLSGPSGSGKTTTAMKIAEALCKLGVGSQSLAMDDYFRTVDLRDIIVGPCWKLKDSGEDFTWLSNEHCMLLVGYDETHYLFNDPWNNNGVIAYDRATVEDRYQKQHMQAVSVVRA